VATWWPNHWLGLFAVCCHFIASWQLYPLVSSVHIGKSDSKLTLLWDKTRFYFNGWSNA